MPCICVFSHCESVLVYGVKACPNLADLHVTGYPAVPIPLAEETAFSPLCTLASSFLKGQWTRVVQVYFWALHSLPLIQRSVFTWRPHTVWITVALWHCLKPGRVMPLALLFSLRTALAVLGLFGLIQNLGLLVIIRWKHHGQFYRDHIKSTDCFVQYGHVNYINSSTPKAWDIYFLESSLISFSVL